VVLAGIFCDRHHGRLRAALESIVKHCNTNGMQRWPIALIATAALAEEKKDDRDAV